MRRHLPWHDFLLFCLNYRPVEARLAPCWVEQGLPCQHEEFKLTHYLFLFIGI